MRQFQANSSIIDRSNIALAAYLRDVNRYPLISADEEVELARLIHKGGKEGEKAKEKLVNANLRFVVSVANHYKCNDAELQDLISEGNLGLIKAAELFDETKGFKFISYAINWIRQFIFTAKEKNGDLIRKPNNHHRQMALYKKFVRDTMQREQRLPSVEEFAAYAGITDIDDARRVVESYQKTVSIDEPLSMGDDCDETFGNFIAGDMRADRALDLESMRQDVKMVLTAVLPPRQCDIIKRSFGIDCEQQTLDSIAMEMGLSRERTRQVREKGLKKLRSSGNIQILRRYLNAG